MNDHHLKISDYVAASMPLAASGAGSTIASLTLAEWHSVAGIAGAIIGAAYLLWKWRKEAKKSDSRPPFPLPKQ